MMMCPRVLLSKSLTPPWSAGLLLAACVGVLATAFVAQFVLGHEPCILCLWQRVPYGVVIILAALALLRRTNTRILLGFIALVFLIGAGLAVFHTGVELHWWLGTSGCAIKPLHGDSIASLREQLLKTVTARCDEITWTFLGFSFANWNILTSLALSLFAGLAARNARGAS